MILIGINFHSHDSASSRILIPKRSIATFDRTMMEPTEEDSVPLLNLNSLP